MPRPNVANRLSVEDLFLYYKYLYHACSVEFSKILCGLSWTDKKIHLFRCFIAHHEKLKPRSVIWTYTPIKSRLLNLPLVDVRSSCRPAWFDYRYHRHALWISTCLCIHAPAVNVVGRIQKMLGIFFASYLDFFIFIFTFWNRKGRLVKKFSRILISACRR